MIAILLFIGVLAFMAIWHLVASFIRAGRELREWMHKRKAQAQEGVASK